jgi:hypothetical protein
LRGGRGGGSPKIEPNCAAAGKVPAMATTIAVVTIIALEKLAAISGLSGRHCSRPQPAG